MKQDVAITRFRIAEPSLSLLTDEEILKTATFAWFFWHVNWNELLCKFVHKWKILAGRDESRPHIGYHHVYRRRCERCDLTQEGHSYRMGYVPTTWKMVSR